MQTARESDGREGGRTKRKWSQGEKIEGEYKWCIRIYTERERIDFFGSF